MGNGEIHKHDNIDFRSWLDNNLRGRVHTKYGNEWPTTFTIVAWGIWKWRNERIFKGENHETKRKLQWIERHGEEIRAAFRKN